MEDLFSLNSKLKLEEYEFSSDDFELASESSKENFMTKTPPTSYLQDALRRLKENKVAMVSIGFLIIVCIFAFIGPFLVKGDYTTQYRGDENLFPCLRYPFGTDKLGRDLMVRTMYGTRVSLIVGIFASFIVLIIGTIYGAISGYFGGRVDAIMMRILDLIYSIPDVLVVILLSIGISQPMKSFVNSSSSEFAKKIGVLGPALISIFIAFGLLYWVGMARIIRGQVLMLKKQEFVTAVEALGGSKKRIIRRHLFPNCIGQVIVMTAMQIPSAIFLESFLSFLGIGVSAPMTSLGALAADALGGIYSYAYRLIIPSCVSSL